MKKKKIWLWTIPGILVVLIAAFIPRPRPIEEEPPMDITLTVASSAFTDGGVIPDRYAERGEGMSPPLTVTDVPADAVSVAVIMDDIDAPTGVFTHWVIWNIPPGTDIPEGIPEGEEVPDLNARQGKNSMFQVGYMGPEPPSGTHRYRFHVYALDGSLDLGPGATRSQLERAMEGHILGYGLLTGEFSK